MDYITIYNEYMAYENSYKFVIQTVKTGAKACWEIIQKPDNIIVNLKNIKYTPEAGIADLEINKMMKHASVNISGDYFTHLMSKYNSSEFNSQHTSFFTTSIVSFVLTSQKLTTLYDLDIMKFNPILNQIIADKKIFGYFGSQYISRMSTIMKEKDLTVLKDYMKYMSFYDVTKSVSNNMFKNISDILNKMDKNHFFDTKSIFSKKFYTENDYIDFYRFLLTENYNMNNKFNSIYENLSYKNNLIDKRNICQILYNMSIVYDECINIALIEFDCLIIDSKELNKLIYEGANDIDSLVELIDEKIKLKNLNPDEIKKCIKAKTIKGFKY